MIHKKIKDNYIMPNSDNPNIDKKLNINDIYLKIKDFENEITFLNNLANKIIETDKYNNKININVKDTGNVTKNELIKIMDNLEKTLYNNPNNNPKKLDFSIKSNKSSNQKYIKSELIFFGISLSQNLFNLPIIEERKKISNINSITHQNIFDLGLLGDKQYKYSYLTNKEGWEGGGNNIKTGVNPSIDSTHIELYRPYTMNSINHNGISLKKIVDRMSNLKFDPIKITITGIHVTDLKEYQCRFNPEILDIKLILNDNFRKVTNLTNVNTFDSSLLRNICFYSKKTKHDFLSKNKELIKNYPKSQITNNFGDYKQIGSGGIYLFITKNRPLFYFTPNGKVYYCRWMQIPQVGSQYVEVMNINPLGKGVKESLLEITGDNLYQYKVIRDFQKLCDNL